MTQAGDSSFRGPTNVSKGGLNLAVECKSVSESSRDRQDCSKWSK